METLQDSRMGSEPTPNFVGRYLVYPDLTGKRRAEGGLRLAGTERCSTPDKPLVTIITVCFNSARTIEQTIRSVREQTYGNIEYIVVDGASTDGTIDILKAHEDLIDYYISEPDEGLYFAMNKGLELARGEYILILNSDDWYVPDAVEALVQARDYSGCDFTAALARYVDEEKGKSEVLRSMPFDDSAYFRMPLRHETMLLPAWLYDKLGPYDTAYRIIADRDYTARLFDAQASFYELPRALLNFRITGLSNTNIELLNAEQDALLAKEFPFLSDAERTALTDVRNASPETYAEVANAHLDQPKLVKACRALLDDRRTSGGKRWQSGAVETIGTVGRDALPKVSVILPFYEAAGTIAASLESVLGQTLQELEIICVNDCAIDDSQNVIDEYLKRDIRVKCIRNARNIGLGASRNAGIRAAHGRYIFHLDPDDTMPRDGLELLYEAAVLHGSEMVKGAYTANQGLHQKAAGNVTVKYPCGVDMNTVPNTALSLMPQLLHTTEGHWSYLYDANFARRVPYPTDLKMGQDSIFLVNAVARASKITLLPKVVYHYEANPNSAMNRFTARKYFDGLEWRRRAWHVLRDANQLHLGERLLFNYWSDAFFEGLDEALTSEERQKFYARLVQVLRSAGYPGTTPPGNTMLSARFDALMNEAELLDGKRSTNKPEADEKTLKVATFSTQDHGGAAIGSLRRIEALRSVGVHVELYSLFRKHHDLHARQMPVDETCSYEALRSEWRKTAVLTRQEHPGLTASEMFSKTGSVTDFRAARPIFDRADIVHMHWVSGMFDYAHVDVLADKPVAWTLADMNAFTGGCHYSEGCTEYRNECRECPLLEKGSTLAHEAWKVKHEAYAQLRNLHIICPSQWLADCVRESSLLGDRPVHMIPNALPVDRFTPTNRLVARQMLGLPLDRKLVAFGADSLSNRRKGGDILAEAMEILRERGQARDVEGLFFGASSLDLGIRTHSMGHVSDETKMSLIYAAADVFAFPSRGDNAPLTVVESLLSGTPVVGFPVGNVPELVTHRETGYIAEYADAGDFAEGLAWALARTDGAEALMRGLRGHVKARAHNDPETAVARHLELYHQMLEQNVPDREVAAQPGLMRA